MLLKFPGTQETDAPVWAISAACEGKGEKGTAAQSRAELEVIILGVIPRGSFSACLFFVGLSA